MWLFRDPTLGLRERGWVAWAERILAFFALPGKRVSNPCRARGTKAEMNRR